MVFSNASSNMLAPASIASDENQLITQYSTSKRNNTMYLGHWLDQISDKLNPVYYSNLTRFDVDKSFSENQFNIEKNFILAPVFLENAFGTLLENSDFYFSFASNTITINQSTMNQLFDYQFQNLSPQLNKTKSNNQLVQQEYYTPGYFLSHGKSTVGVSAVLLQQRFLDKSFGSAIFDSALTNTLFADQTYLNTNKGIGYQLSFSQDLPFNINFSFDYQSKIKLNEFDTYGKSYSDPGNFDIPSQYTSTIGYNISKNSDIKLSAEKISYSQVDAVVHSGYSQTFLNAVNSPISPIFNLKDLFVYSLNYTYNISNVYTINIDITSRQQAPATASIYNKILKNDTAAYSYKIGISKALPVGELNFLASFANKPLLIGRTDFGRISNSSLNNHIEGVASWKYVF